jgi:NADH:ubiquinone oxidoreductase subunit 5 (subunit L)/multisubunit Na+/H+ antiporter MnhA subunit|tara:strand:- start:1183 stop:1365 length:183 start_codon:yes stop_codon:yes gene_type:complete
MLVNRVGDVGLMLGICATFLAFKTVDYAIVFGLTPIMVNKTFSFFGFDFAVLTVVSFLIF